MKWLEGNRIRLVVVGIVTSIVLGSGHAKADFTFGKAVNLKSIIPVIDPAHDAILCFSYDGLEIYIWSDRPGGYGGSDLWVLKRNSVDEVWGEPENLGPAINSAQDEGNVSISGDGLTLYLDSDRPGGYGFEDIYMATRATKNAPWEPAVNMGSKINSSTTEANPHITADGLELYFQSGRFGDADIYVARRATTNDPWSDQVNLGPPVSSAYLDNDPVPSADGRLLMFSDFYKCPPFRPGGYGGSDIWMSKQDSLSGSWQEPINLGSNVNTTGHELIPCFSSDGRALHFNSLRGGTWDNWQVSILPVVDLNADGIVDSADMCIIVDHWGEDYSLCDVGPMPWGDGIVDVQDLIVLAENLFEEVDDPTLVAHWPLDEKEGMYAADSVGENNAMIVGGAIWQPSGGQIDGALQLDGIDDYVITDPVLNPTDGVFSVLAWIKGDAPSQVVISQEGGANWLMTDTEGNLMTELRSPGRNGSPILSQTNITDGNWQRLGLVWDGLHRILYVDSVVVAIDTQDGLQGSDSGLYIGCGKDMEAGTFFSGLIDDVRIYNRAVRP